MKKRMKNLKNVPQSDECYTPAGTVKYLLEFIPDYVKTIWRPCDTEESNIVKELKSFGYDVLHTHIKDGFDFLNYQPIPPFYDMIITNPPFSKKTKFLARAYSLGKPFIFYLPLTALEGTHRQLLFKEYGINVAVLGSRLNFTNGKGAWFNTSLFIGNVDYKDRLFYIDNTKEDPEEKQYELFTQQ